MKFKYEEIDAGDRVYVACEIEVDAPTRRYMLGNAYMKANYPDTNGEASREDRWNSARCLREIARALEKFVADGQTSEGIRMLPPQPDKPRITGTPYDRGEKT